MKKLSFLIALAGCAVTTQAQIQQFVGEPAVQAFRVDFDRPFVSSGPIAGNAAPMTDNGIRDISLVGSWLTGGDTITAASNASGQSLVSDQGGRLFVGGVGAPLDNPGANAGFSITLQAPTTEFGVLFIDQINFDYRIELFLGGTAIARAVDFRYGGFFPAPGHYWNEASGMTFDGVLITFPTGTNGVGIDNIVISEGGGCYADCDTTTGIGVLDLFDFLCFQGSFVAGEAYACDCDTSTGPLNCDLFDFLCFQGAFVAGCP